MAAADELIKAGNLAQAKVEILETVKRAPQDQGARMYLFQLLLVTGEWEKALIHLRALAQISAEAQMLATVYNGLIETEKSRTLAYAGKLDVPFLISKPAWSDDFTASFKLIGKGEIDEGLNRRALALEVAAEAPGTFNGTEFSWIADVDSRLGPNLEVVIGGQWGLIPFELIEQVTTDGPQNLRDLVWLPAEFRFKTGQSGAGFIPARYPGSEKHADSSVVLGRSTVWENGVGDEEYPVGQRLFWSGEELDFSLFELRTLSVA